MNLQALGLHLVLYWATVAQAKVDEHFVNRMLAGEDTACEPLVQTSDSCLVDPKPKCTPFRSVDYCAESFQRNIQRRNSAIKDDDSVWLRHLNDKLAGYKVAASLGLNPPKIHYCTDDVSSLSENAPSTGGFVVRATDLHSNNGIYVLPFGFGGKELISGIEMTAEDVETHLSALAVDKVIIEEYVGSPTRLPLEVKFHMFDGEVGSINIVANRGTDCSCWAEMDTDQNRLDQYGCFVSGGTEESKGECTTIDFEKGQKTAHPMKGMDLCSDLPPIDDCAMKEMIAIAKEASVAVGVYVRVDMFLSEDNKAYLQEFSTNHMNGLRHCSAIKRDNGCLDPCFQGELWKTAGGNATLGGTLADIPTELSNWLSLPNESQKFEDIAKTEIKPTPASACAGRSEPTPPSPATKSPEAITPSPVAADPTDAPGTQAREETIAPVTVAPVTVAPVSPTDQPATVASTPSPVTQPPVAVTASPDAGKQSGTSAETQEPEDTVAPVTIAPVTPPTTPFTAVQSFTCPGGEASLNITVSGTVKLQNSVDDKLCTLVVITSDGHLKPAGRSYSSSGWESVRGDYSALKFDCDKTACTVDLPTLASGSRYELTSFDKPSYTTDDTIARFLEQTTFGPTQTEIAGLSNGSGRRVLKEGADSNSLEAAFANWVKDHQTTVPMSSHREFYRTRMNARFEFATLLGAVTHPCQKNTRYRRFALSHKDKFKVLTIDTVGSKTLLILDGFVRTIVNGPVVSTDGKDTFEDGNYVLCHKVPENYIGGEVKLETASRKCTAVCFDSSQCGNPAISFNGTSPVTVISLDEQEVKPIDQQFNVGRDVVVQELMTVVDLADPKCSSLGEPGNPVELVYATYQGELWIHDPRFELFDNTVDTPSSDGGGSLAEANTNFGNPEYSAKCANVPSTFVNEGSCYLSKSSDACGIGSGASSIDNGLDFSIPLDNATIRAVYEESGAGNGDTVFLYAVDQLRIENDTLVQPPCQTDTESRWVTTDCADYTASMVDSVTESTFAYLIALKQTKDSNPNVVDVILTDSSCADEDESKVGFIVNNGEGKCYRNVHPDHLNVYDFTPWTSSDPDIVQFAEAGAYKIQWHETTTWQMNKSKFRKLGRLGDDFNYYEIPENFRTNAFNQAVGFDPDMDGVPLRHKDATTDSSGTLVCGSPNEIANNPLLGGSQERGAFDSRTDNILQSTHDRYFDLQKRTIWTQIALEGKDQLRQRVAWALSQILAVATKDIDGGPTRTEIFVNFYDIFVRHAFGNYRDILREVSYNAVMANMLTYFGSRSTAFEFERYGHVQFADENFAREVMQLFTMGLFKLSSDGREIFDDNGEAVQVYSNDDIVEYARVWTGFTNQLKRGNIEMDNNKNRIDPMKINVQWRDPFPKMGVDRKYIGDGVPLCADLPEKHFLSVGATYKLLGRSPVSQIQQDPAKWMDDATAKRLKLEANGSDSLFAKLCGSIDSGDCQFEPKIVLEENLKCSGLECSIDTVRTVEVDSGIFYEYIRPPCVHQAFYDSAKVVSAQKWSVNVMCADPRTEVATTACCPEGVEWRDRKSRRWNNTYWGERVTFATASERCDDKVCINTAGPKCTKTFCDGNDRFWTDSDCKLFVKIDKSGNAAIVHSPGLEQDTQKLVREDTKTFFRVDWSDTSEVANVISNCGTISGCQVTTDSMCMCEVSVAEEQVFFDSNLPSAKEVLDYLHIGAFNPNSQDSSPVKNTSDQVTWYSAADTLTSDSVFEVTDSTGTTQLRKNMKSTVKLVGADLSFRNPIHFMSLEDAEPRDAYYETEAALDSYFYHSNVAPFLAIRFAQRFGISNPSPGFVQRIVDAFRTGSYVFVGEGSTVTYGEGKYGDLAATIACVLLDKEARSTVLDADPAHGGMKEPLIKIISLMRSMSFKLFDYVPQLVKFRYDLADNIGQMAHDVQSVFSFFLSEHKAAGPVAQASIVAPEAVHNTGPKIISQLNGMLGLIKYGLDSCWDGLGTQERERGGQKCGRFEIGKFDESSGRLTYTPTSTSAKDTTDEMATLLTGGRLNPASRETINQIFTDETDRDIAVIKAQMAIVTAPEFHATNLVRKTGSKRPKPELPIPSSKPYKAVVYVLMAGGFDSYNMLVPHTCTSTNANGKTAREQYDAERTTLAFADWERTRIIDATGQPCDQFAIHQDLPIVEQLYKEGDLNFFANVGVLNAPVTKKNYKAATRTNLFGHNTMQEEVRKNDPFDGQQGTGILGRACDQLNEKGFSAKSITLTDSTIATVGSPGKAVDPLIVSSRGVVPFNTNAYWREMYDPRPIMDDLNDETDSHSSLFGETWSSRLNTALSDNEQLESMLGKVTLTQSWWRTDQTSKKFETAAKAILTREERGADRDVIYLELHGWDMHSELKPKLKANFIEFNEALTNFKKEMVEQGLWDDIAVVITSDFGRTLTTNSGMGSDHAWGGNYFVAGGSVMGGQVLGKYPQDLTEDGDLNIGRGRLLPTSGWESIWNSVVEWMGS